jgi:hypothetical protein
LSGRAARTIAATIAGTLLTEVWLLPMKSRVTSADAVAGGMGALDVPLPPPPPQPATQNPTHKARTRRSIARA